MQGIPHPANFWTTARHSAQFRAQFRAQHHLAHVAYEQALGGRGISLPGCDFSQEVNKDWLLRHDSRHQALRIIVGHNTNAPTVDLASLDFTDSQAVRAWQQYHAQLHADIETFLGMAFR